MYPAKHQFRLAWPRAWWPKGTEHFYSGSSSSDGTSSKSKRKEGKKEEGTLSLDIPETPQSHVGKSNGDDGNKDGSMSARSNKAGSGTPGGVLYTPSSAGILSPESLSTHKNMHGDVANGDTSTVGSGYGTRRDSGRRDSATREGREGARHSSLNSDAGRDSVYGDEFHTGDRGSISSLRDSLTMPLEEGDSPDGRTDGHNDEDSDVRMSAYGNDAVGTNDTDAHVPVSSISRFFSNITSTNSDESRQRFNSTSQSSASDGSPSSSHRGNRSRFSSSSSDVLAEYCNTNNDNNDVATTSNTTTSTGGTGGTGTSSAYPSELTEEMLEAARKHMAAADAVCVYDSDDSYASDADINADTDDVADADTTGNGNRDGTSNSSDGDGNSGTSTPVMNRSRGVSDASLVSDASDAA